MLTLLTELHVRGRDSDAHWEEHSKMKHFMPCDLPRLKSRGSARDPSPNVSSPLDTAPEDVLEAD